MATETIVEEVADNLQEASETIRRLNPKSIGYFVIGAGVGASIGFYFGHRWRKEQLRAEAFTTSEAELEEIRQYYMRTVNKPKLEEIIDEKGYGQTPDIPERPLPPPVPVQETLGVVPNPETDLVPEDRLELPSRPEPSEKDKDEGWSFPFELSQRTPHKPYIIHQDEFYVNESEYNQSQLMYFVEDDILADDDAAVIANRETLIGVKTLERFGHGADDSNVLYVRNPHLEIEWVIVRVPRSYEIEVMGLHDEPEADDSA